MNRLRRRIDAELIVLFLFSSFALAPLLSPGYFFDAHDADHSVFFLVQFDAAIRDGALWPRWGPDLALGYGYPLWLLYAPLAYYVAEGFHLLGLGFTAAVKMTWALGFLLGGWGMFALLRRWWGDSPAGRAAALVGGLLYVYAPYHLLNIYVRAAFAEFTALAWFPWVLLAFDDLVERPSPRQIALAGLALAGLLLTHTGTILIFTPLLAAYLLFALLRQAYQRGTDPLHHALQDAGDPNATLTALGASPPWRRAGQAFWRAGLRQASAGLLAAGLAAIFLLPMLLEQRYIVQSQWIQDTYNYRLHFVFPSQFLDPAWGYGFSDDPTGPNDGMSFQLGIAGVALALAGAVLGLRRQAQRPSLILFFLLATLAILLATLPLAQPLWDAIGPAALLQFPWRLLGVASFTLSILAASAIRNSQFIDSRLQWEAPVAYGIALAVVLASFAFTQPEYTDITPLDESPSSIIRFETTYQMIGVTVYTEEEPLDSPLVSQYLSGQALEKAALLSGSGRVETLRVGGASVEALVEAEDSSSVIFYTYDFPGWRATLDGRPVEHRHEPPHGLIVVDVPAGQHVVAIRHGATPARTVGVLISLASLALVAGLFWLDGRQRQPA